MKTKRIKFKEWEKEYKPIQFSLSEDDFFYFENLNKYMLTFGQMHEMSIPDGHAWIVLGAAKKCLHDHVHNEYCFAPNSRYIVTRKPSIGKEELSLTTDDERFEIKLIAAY